MKTGDYIKFIFNATVLKPRYDIGVITNVTSFNPFSSNSNGRNTIHIKMLTNRDMAKSCGFDPDHVTRFEYLCRPLSIEKAMLAKLEFGE